MRKQRKIANLPIFSRFLWHRKMRPCAPAGHQRVTLKNPSPAGNFGRRSFRSIDATMRMAVWRTVPSLFSLSKATVRNSSCPSLSVLFRKCWQGRRCGDPRNGNQTTQSDSARAIAFHKDKQETTKQPVTIMRIRPKTPSPRARKQPRRTQMMMCRENLCRPFLLLTVVLASFALLRNMALMRRNPEEELVVLSAASGREAPQQQKQVMKQPPDSKQTTRKETKSSSVIISAGTIEPGRAVGDRFDTGHCVVGLLSQLGNVLHHDHGRTGHQFEHRQQLRRRSHVPTGRRAPHLPPTPPGSLLGRTLGKTRRRSTPARQVRPHQNTLRRPLHQMPRGRLRRGL